MQAINVETAVSVAIILVLSFVLTIIMLRQYFATRRSSVFFWSLGMYMFTIGVLLELIFALGFYTVSLANMYLFSVALLVEFLALGSVQLIKNEKVKKAFATYVVLSSAFVIYSLAASNVGYILVNGVVYGSLPLIVVISSSVATFPSAIAIIWVALSSYLKTKSIKMLSIIIGVVEVSVAGTLYIVSFPAFLYFAEFLGILLLWLGFFNFKRFSKPARS